MCAAFCDRVSGRVHAVASGEKESWVAGHASVYRRISLAVRTETHWGGICHAAESVRRGVFSNRASRALPVRQKAHTVGDDWIDDAGRTAIEIESLLALRARPGENLAVRDLGSGAGEGVHAVRAESLQAEPPLPEISAENEVSGGELGHSGVRF